MPRPKVLFICGSLNQTTQMHQIAQHLPETDSYFTAWYSANPAANALIRTGFFDQTILAGEFRRKTDAYIHANGLQMDYQGRKHRYDLVVTCSDLLHQGNIRNSKVVWVQEGMIDPMTPLNYIVKTLGLPGFWAFNTALNGSTRHYTKYCVASEGFGKLITKRGADPSKIAVTGIPNFDNFKIHLNNDFPYKNYVFVATSDIREAFRKEDRMAFLRRCVTLAAGRELIFKLHPNEIASRAKAEIRRVAPNALIFTEGNANDMVANCHTLITQYSSLAFVGIVLNKIVHSFFNVHKLKEICPIQNEGRSAENIAQVCKQLLHLN